MANTLGYGFLTLIVMFAVISTIYLYANDFSRETLDVLFPAAGAILLSAYLGIKSIWIDAPQPTKFSVTIAILHDIAHGQIRGMAPRDPKYATSFDEHRGAHLIDTLPIYNAFKGIDFGKVLRDLSNTPDSPAETMIEHIVEYALLDWLRNGDVSAGYIPGSTIRLLGASSGGYGVSTDLVNTNISGGDKRPNPLLKTLPIKISLPPGSKIIRSNDDRSMFTIRTRHSAIQFRQTGSMKGGGYVPGNMRSQRIFEALGLSGDVKHIQLIGYAVEVTATQKPFSRHSKQAKQETAWINRLQEQIQKDFSWEALESVYASD